MIVTTKRDLKVTSNKASRTFTLAFTYSDGSKVKYRTTPMSKEDFDSCQYNTRNDWEQFLKSEDYYKI